MRSWHVVAVGAVLGGWFCAVACGSDPGKRAARHHGGGASGLGGDEATDGGTAGTQNPAGGTGADSPGNGGAPGAGAGGSDASAGASPGGGGEPPGNGGAGPGTVLTSCDAPLVIDDLPAANIAPDQATITQAPGGPTLITWREGDKRKGRVLTGNTLGKVVTFPEAVAGSEYYPHFAVSGSGGLIYTTPNTALPSLMVYDSSDDSWSPDEHTGLWFNLMQFLSNGDSLHVVTDAVGGTGSLQVRSKAGVWGTATPLYNIAPDRIYTSQLRVDSQDRGALVAATGQTAPALKGWAIRDGAFVAEASLAIAASASFTELFSALLPNGDVLMVYQHSGDTVLRAVTFSYDEVAEKASFSKPVELEQAPTSPYGLAVDARGDATLSYSLAGGDLLRRRVGGVWGVPTPLGVSDGWYADPVVDANGTAFIARANGDYTKLTISSSAAGSLEWSEPLDVMGDFGWTSPQRPRLGLHESGVPMVAWTGSNASGGRDILLSVCH